MPRFEPDRAAPPSLARLHRALGGEISNGQILCPGPGHRPSDRSLAVRPSPTAPDGFVVTSFSPRDGWDGARDHVKARLGIPLGKAPGRDRHAPDTSRSDRAVALWNEAVDPRGTLVEQYLRGRGLELPDQVRGTAIRFHPNCPFGERQRHPCMVAAFRSIDGGPITAIHRTALAADGSKLDRKMLGSTHGAAIMLAEHGADLAIGEGIESALAAMQLGFAPVWALGSAGAIERLPVVPGVKRLTILGERNDGGANDRAARQCAARWIAAGAEAKLVLPAKADDMNDALRDGDTFETEVVTADAPQSALNATPFRWREPSTLPTRQFLYGRHLIRKYISADIAAGGVGKSSLTIVEALAVATGKDLLGVGHVEQANVWLWNGEDDRDELDRRIIAAMTHHGIRPADVEGRLFVDSGRDMPIVMAEQTRDGTRISAPVFDAFVENVRRNEIGVWVIDPFISSHQVSENDNVAIDMVAKTYARIADVTNSAGLLVHHARKTGGNAATVEDGRGAVALLAAVRSARALNGMTEDEAAKAGVENRKTYFRAETGKANLHIAPDKATWFHMTSVSLGNGPAAMGGEHGADSVGVVTAWEWPDPLSGMTVDDLRKAQAALAIGGPWRENAQASRWAGFPIGEALGLDPRNKPADKAKIKGMLRVWIANGMFAVVTGKDSNGDDRPFIEVGETAND